VITRRLIWISAVGAIAIAAALVWKHRDKGHLNGQPSVVYVSSSDSVALFDLENRTTQTLKIVGTRDWRTGVEVGLAEYGIECRKDGKSDESPAGFSDPPRYFELRPGESVRVTVRTDLPHRYRGGLCQLALLEQSFARIESREFMP
jgi:hypothetical protein